MKPKSLTFDMHFAKVECYLILNRYKADKTLAIDLVNTDGEPITRLTVCATPMCLTFNKIYDVAFVDVNNNPSAMQFFEGYKLGKRVKIKGKTVIYTSGFCEYPLYKFNLNELRKYAIHDNTKL